MNSDEFKIQMDKRTYIEAGSEMHLHMHENSERARKITTEMNNKFHTAEELRALFSKLTGKPVDGGSALFYRLRAEYHYRQKRVCQFRLLLSRPRRHSYRR